MTSRSEREPGRGRIGPGTPRVPRRGSRSGSGRSSSGGPGGGPRDRSRRWSRNALAFSLSFLLSLAALDLFVQGAEIQSPMENSVVERIGLMYAPDFRFSRFSEGFFLGRTNSYGCLGKGAPRKREGDEIRILFLGDSFALGHTVFERHHFGRTIEQVVSAATGRPVTVLNFARADFALSNLHQHYIDFASQWDHDVALFFADHTDLDPRRHASRTFYPYASIQGDSLHYDYSFFGTSMARTYARWEPLLHRTVLPRFVFEFLKVEDRGDLPHLIFDKLLPGRMPTVAPPVPVAEADPMPEVTRLVLDALADEPQVVLVLSGPVHPDYEAVIHELGIPALDLNPVLARLEEGGIDPYWWTVTGERGHWNHKAHDAIGEALGHGLLDRLR